MSTFEAFALLIDGGRTIARNAGGDRGGPSSLAGPSRKTPPGGRAAPEKTLADLRNLWVNGVNGAPNGVNCGVNGRRLSAISHTAISSAGASDKGRVSYRTLLLTSRRSRPPQRRSCCRPFNQGGGRGVGR
jgi:hypothetical protein